MNAYELADELDGWSDHWLSDKGEDDVFKAHATMLRQQEDRIKEMEQECNAMREQLKHLESQVYGGVTK